VLVLSYGAGAARELDGAVLVNPMDPDEIAEGLNQALTMPRDERLDRWGRMATLVREHSAKAWSKAYLAALEG
jgi:trehalose 6-phosphate synthase